MNQKKTNVSNKLDQSFIDSIKGFMDQDEGRALHDIALEASRRGPCLEIGSYCGKSAVYLGSACRENGAILFSIDHHRGSEEQQPGEAYFDPSLYDYKAFCMKTLSFFRQTLALSNLEETVVPIVSASEVVARAWATPLSLVFIDGGHAFETAKRDYESWSDQHHARRLSAHSRYLRGPRPGRSGPLGSLQARPGIEPVCRASTHQNAWDA